MSESFIRAATDLRNRGFAICWLTPGEKNPRHRGWTKRTQEPGDYFDGANLAILPGELSDDLICVDLDSPAAIDLAPQHLPATGTIDGRPSKQRSHWFFRVTSLPPEETSAAGNGGGPRTRRFRGVCDFLGTGSCVTVPPSIVKGEPREWSATGEPSTVTYAELRSAVNRIVEALAPLKRPPGRPRKAALPLPNNPQPFQGVVDFGRYIARLDPAIDRQGGRDQLWKAIKLGLNDFALSVDQAYPDLVKYNARCLPPFSDEVLNETIAKVAAEPPAPDRGCKLRGPAETWNDPSALATDFEREQTWRLWQETYWRYTGTHYAKQSESDLADALTESIQREIDRREWNRKPRVTQSLVYDVLGALRPSIKLAERARLPSMLGDASAPPLLAVENGLLDLSTETLRPHTPDWFSRNSLPVRYDPAASFRAWADVLSTLFEDDRQRVDLLGEWFGYTLWNGFSAQKFLILHGDGGTGKSTVLAALKCLIGDGNYSAVSFADFGNNRFAFAPTLGMMLNVSADIDAIDRFADGKFKSFVTGEELDFEFKGIDKITTRPTAKLILATNVLPHFSDRSDGVWRRALHLPMNYIVPKSDRVPSMDQTAFWQPHLSGILNWSLTGLRRLRDAGWNFTESQAGNDLAREHRLDSDAARDFLLSHYAIDRAASPVRFIDLYSRYRDYCATSGISYPLKLRAFNRSVRQVLKGIDSGSNRFGEDSPPHLRGVHKCWIHLLQTADIALASRDGPSVYRADPPPGP